MTILGSSLKFWLRKSAKAWTCAFRDISSRFWYNSWLRTTEWICVMHKFADLKHFRNVQKTWSSVGNTPSSSLFSSTISLTLNCLYFGAPEVKGYILATSTGLKEEHLFPLHRQSFTGTQRICWNMDKWNWTIEEFCILRSRSGHYSNKCLLQAEFSCNNRKS